MDKIIGQVRCSGKIHRISITPNGPVTLHNHTSTDLAADRIMVALGGDPCRCVQILRAWRAKDRSKLPVWARQPLDDSRQFSRRRRWARSVMNRDPFILPVTYRIREKILTPLWEALRACSYQSSKTQREQLADYNFDDADGFHPTIHRVRGTYPRINITLNLFRWYNHVCKHDLAVIDGLFVLDVLSQDESGYTVLVGRQNKDLSINVVKARVDITNKNTLIWLDNTGVAANMENRMAEAMRKLRVTGRSR